MKHTEPFVKSQRCNYLVHGSKLLRTKVNCGLQNLRFTQQCCCRFQSILDGTICHWMG